MPRFGGMFVLCISGFLHGNERVREREGDPQRMVSWRKPPREPPALLSNPTPALPPGNAAISVRISLLPLHFCAIKIFRADWNPTRWRGQTWLTCGGRGQDWGNSLLCQGPFALHKCGPSLGYCISPSLLLIMRGFGRNLSQGDIQTVTVSAGPR